MANKLETLIENVNALVESEDGSPTDAMMLKDNVDYLNTQVDEAIAKYEELNG